MHHLLKIGKLSAEYNPENGLVRGKVVRLMQKTVA
jgi:hypothetical protein